MRVDGPQTTIPSDMSLPVVKTTESGGILSRAIVMWHNGHRIDEIITVNFLHK